MLLLLALLVACPWLQLFNEIFSGTFAACIIPAILFYIEDCDVETVKKQYERKLQLEKTAVAGLKVKTQVLFVHFGSYTTHSYNINIILVEWTALVKMFF